MALGITAFGDNTGFFHLLPSHHLFASTTAADVVPPPNPAEGMGNAEVPGRAGAEQTGLEVVAELWWGKQSSLPWPWEAAGILAFPRGERLSSSAGSVGGRGCWAGPRVGTNLASAVAGQPPAQTEEVTIELMLQLCFSWKKFVWVTWGWGLAVQQLPVPNPSPASPGRKAHCGMDICSLQIALHLFLLSVLTAFGQNLLEGSKRRHNYVNFFQKQFPEKSRLFILEYLYCNI